MKNCTTLMSPSRRTGSDRVAAALVAELGRRLRRGHLRVEMPAGEVLEFGTAGPGEIHAVWRLHRYRPLWALFTRGALGLAESYLAGDWDSPDLTALLVLAASNERDLGRVANGCAWMQWRDRLWHRARANAPRQARRNIAYHYDLGNAFYSLWLDAGMTYSAALFDAADETCDTGALEAAQTRKYARLAALAGIARGEHVLEIGCGWGGFMAYAAGTLGASVTGVSISREQCAYATRRLAQAGLDGRAQVALRDYRELDGRYQRIVSIEMFEAVGEAYWDTYAARLAALLAPGGAAALQVITIEPARFEHYRRNPDFIQRYVFPGGMLPTVDALGATFARAGLAITACEGFGADYARTLAAWRERFETAWPEIAALGFDARFQRLWRYYLAYCTAGFLCGATDVVQIRLEHAR